MAIYKEHSFAILSQTRTGTAAGVVPLVLWRDKVNTGDEIVVNYHRDFGSLYVIRRGRGVHVIENVRYAVSRGDIYAMNPGMTHHFEGCDALLTDTLHFAPEIFDAAARSALATLPGFRGLFVPAPDADTRTPDAGGTGRWLHLSPAAYAQVAEMVAELAHEWASGTPEGALLARGLFLRLVITLSRHHATLAAPRDAGGAERGLPRAPHENTVAQAVRFMEAGFADGLRVETVASHVCLSPDRFTEVFAEQMGRTPRDYLRFLRMERAKMLLETTDMSIATVAESSGFGESARFARVFRAETGMTPRDFRRMASG